MHIFPHKAKGKGWLFCREVDWKTGEFISPSARVMVRPYDEFGDDFILQEKDAVGKGIVTKEQVMKLKEVRLSRADDILLRLGEDYIGMIKWKGKKYAMERAQKELKLHSEIQLAPIIYR